MIWAALRNEQDRPRLVDTGFCTTLSLAWFNGPHSDTWQPHVAVLRGQKAIVPCFAGCRLVKESEEQGDLPDQSEAPQLWNGQPFLLAPSAPLPDCSKGCARAQPLVKWVRQTHGTGGRAGSFGRW